MNPPPEDLLERLSSGDMEAAERVFAAFEPYLRMAVRRHLPAPFLRKFDSADIVQSTWADLLRGFREAGWRFPDVDHLRGFLFVATRNRLIDRIRQHQKAVEREVRPRRRTTNTPAVPRAAPRRGRPGGRDWERILARCPPEYRPILWLRRQGYSLAEIAGRTGLHPDSVRRIFRTLARRIGIRAEGRGGRVDAAISWASPASHQPQPAPVLRDRLCLLAYAECLRIWRLLADLHRDLPYLPAV